MSVIVNPGSGYIPNSTIEYARENIKQLVKDIGIDNITIFEFERAGYSGRFLFTLSRIGYCGVEIDMPGLPIEQVRYIGSKEQNIWNFPRLYINGSSFVWKFVVNLAKGTYATIPGKKQSWFDRLFHQ